jgi:LuxR family transcriptional regulator, maltose regulon positive regulatory protein
MQAQTSHWLSWFPVTKLRPPSSQETIERAWLTDTLCQMALSHRLTLISAPAGSGKTTLAADLSRRDDQLVARWLSLDAGDNNLQAFLVAVTSALMQDHSHELIKIINNGHIQTRQMASSLVNWLDMRRQMPLVLVLDDLHLLTDADIHVFLDYLIEWLPAHVHIIATTRYDPPLSLTKLRARGELAELRLDELRFSPEEAANYLNSLLQLNLPDHLIERLCQRTEGWIAGLRLLALSLSHIDEDKRAHYLDELAQSDRYVFELLAEEVLAQQSEDMRRFLLETSILAELTPELCQAVTGQMDAARTLHQLHHHNLFLVGLGDGTYRYHALFQDFLRDQLKREDPDRYRAMHRRAAAAHKQTVLAFQHYVAAEAWDEAVDVIREGLTQDVASCIVTLVDMRLEIFIRQLPPYFQENDPWVLLVRGCLAVDRGLYQVGLPLIEAARAMFRQQGAIEGELLSDIQLLIPRLERTDNGDTYPLFCERVQRLVPTIRPEVQFILLIAGIWNSAWNYRHEQLEAFLLQLVDELISQDSEDIYRKFAQSIGYALFFTSQGLDPFARMLPHMEKHAGSGRSVIRMGVCNIRSLLALLRGELGSAMSFARESQGIIRYYGGFAWAEIVVDAVLLSVMLVRRDYAEFDRYYHSRIVEMARLDTSRQYITEFMYLYGRRLLGENKADEARQVCEQMQGNYSFREFEGLELALRAHVARHDGDLQAAEDLMRQAAHIRRETNRHWPTHAGLGLALIYWENDRRELALATLREELAPLAGWGMPGMVILEGRELLPVLEAGIEAGIYPEFAGQCAQALRGAEAPARPIVIPGSSEALTPREVDILRLIVNGASNRAIADSLVITENTVKSHVTRILGKLHAKSRTEAAARVRDLELSL